MSNTSTEERAETSQNSQQPEDEQRYRVFTRTWWRENPTWPNGLEPGVGERSYRGHPDGLTYAEAQAYCKKWNTEHDPGRLSRKAEFEEE